VATYYTQCGYTPANIEELNWECIREQAELLVIRDKEWWVASQERELKARQKEGDREGLKETVGEAEETKKVQEIRSREHQDETRWVPPHPTSDSKPAPQVYEVLGEPPQASTSHDDDDVAVPNCVDTPPDGCQPQPPTTIAHPQSASPPLIHPESATALLGLTPKEAAEVHLRCIRAQQEIQKEIEEEERVWRQQKAERDVHNTHYPPPEHLTDDITSNHNTHIVLSNHHEEPASTANAEPRDDTIGRLAHELGVPREAYEDWADETNRLLGYTAQGEYMETGYLDPTPAPSPPAPWYPPQPPTSDHPPPKTHYRAPYTRYGPLRTYYRPRRTRYCPQTRSPYTQRDTFEN
jgi:hypothetical protein